MKWDGESYCWVDGCTNPAWHERFEGADDEDEIVVIVCCEHAAVPA
jgi:hypothetical protein